MCGRVTLTLSDKMIKKILSEKYSVKQLSIDDFIPRYNISPGQEVLCIINDGKKNRSGYLEWRFVPPWAKDAKEGYKYINARSETVFSKTTFKDSFYNKRCLVIVDSFFEWKREGGKKVPYRFYNEDNTLFALAGIWNVYKGDIKKTYGFSILTTEANELMLPVHHRMPVIIQADDISKWLSNSTSLDDLKSLMKPIDNDYLKCYKVSDYVNSSKNDDEKCIIEDPQSKI